MLGAGSVPAHIHEAAAGGTQWLRHKVAGGPERFRTKQPAQVVLAWSLGKMQAQIAPHAEARACIRPHAPVHMLSSEKLCWCFRGMSTSCLLQLIGSEELQRKADDVASPRGLRGSKRLKLSQAGLLQGELLWGSGLVRSLVVAATPVPCRRMHFDTAHCPSISKVLAAWLVSSGSVQSRRVLELGSGLGTGGLVAATLGAHEAMTSGEKYYCYYWHLLSSAH